MNPQLHTHSVEDDNYQKASKYASPEQQKHLLDLLHQQSEYFLSLCIRDNKVSTAANLQYVALPIAENKSFQKALKCASPDLQKYMLSLIQGQIEYFVKKCMEDNHVEKESELQYVSTHLLLNKN